MLRTYALIPIALATFSAPTSAASQQTLPLEAAVAILSHLENEYEANDWVVATTPGQDAAGWREAARRLNYRFGPKESLVPCTEDRRNCRVRGGDGVVALYEWRREGDDELVVRVILSRQTDLPDETVRLFPELRELTVHRIDDASWIVRGDRKLVVG